MRLTTHSPLTITLIKEREQIILAPIIRIPRVIPAEIPKTKQHPRMLNVTIVEKKGIIQRIAPKDPGYSKLKFEHPRTLEIEEHSVPTLHSDLFKYKGPSQKEEVLLTVMDMNL